MPETTLAPTQPQRTTLYGLFDDLTTILDTLEGLEGQENTDEARAELEAQLHALLADRIPEKIDAFAGHLKRCDGEIEFLKARKKELDGWVEWWQRRIERQKKIARAIIENLPRDAKGKYQKLQGRESQISLREPTGSVVAEDPGALPPQYISVTWTMPATIAAAVIGLVQRWGDDGEQMNAIMQSYADAKATIDKRAIAAAIKAGEEVPGAELAYGDPAVIVK